MKQIWTTSNTTANTGFASGGMTCKFGALCFYSSSVLVDSFVIRNPPQRQAPNRYFQHKMTYHAIKTNKHTKIMKLKLVVFLFLLFSTPLLAQNTSESPSQNISTDSAVVFRLFSTRNSFHFIKLDTRNGQMWQVQWGLESKYRFETVLSADPLVSKEDEKIGRFFLYPTTNVYNFVLLDQIDARTWQVQWGKAEDRLVVRIY
jgi:hypothetical protein